jgi:predicted NACHT family NTPase
MLRNADSLMQLMKQQIDVLVAQDPYLQEFLMWASQKSPTVPTSHNVATSRAFYLALVQSPQTAAQLALASVLNEGTFLDAALDSLLLESAIDHSQDFAYAHVCSEALNNILVMVLDAGFYKSLQQLKDQLPPSSQNRERLQEWWQKNYSAWVEHLKCTIADHRSINHHWQFSTEQHQVLESYYNANQLLVDCLNSNCEVTTTIREEIEATLLLPAI